jgi:hypothetical protein
MKFKTIHTEKNYQIEINHKELRITTPKGSKTISLLLGACIFDTPNPAVAAQLKKQGLNPNDFIFINGYPIRKSARQALEKEFAERNAKEDQMAAERKAKLELQFPGLAELRAAIEDEERYQREFRQMMEDGDNDGVKPPAPMANVGELQKKYPRAAAYLRAESYRYAANDAKAEAGHKAMALLEKGGSIEEAEKILENWLPENAYWN